jgi:hypothetical protein
VIHSPRNIVKVLLLAVFVFASVAGFGVGTAAAKSKPPCWKTLINDWYDGRIDGTYPVHCYRDALKHLPTDVETYSSARDDIRQALQKRLTQGASGGGTTTAGGGKSGGSGPTAGGGNSNGGGGGNTNGGGDKGTPVKSVFGAGKGDHADSFPVALIVLGGIAGLLMAAGAAGFITRRTRTRRLQLAAAATKQPPQTP